MKMAESSPKGWKTVWGKEKMPLVARAIPPFTSVFKGLVMQTRKNQGLFGKGLTTKIPCLTLFQTTNFTL